MARPFLLINTNVVCPPFNSVVLEYVGHDSRFLVLKAMKSQLITRRKDVFLARFTDERALVTMGVLLWRKGLTK